MNMTIKAVFGFLFAGITVAWAAPPSITSAVTPGTMSYQGRLQTPEGVDYDNGIYTVEFRLYDTANETNMLWGATYKPYVNNGFFSVILGQTNVGETPLAGAEYPEVENFWQGVWIDPNSSKKNRFLGITVLEGADNATLASPKESFPRQELLASPFAIQAQFAQQAVLADTATNADHADTADASGTDFSLNGSLISASGPIVLDGAVSITGDISDPNSSIIIRDSVYVESIMEVGGRLHLGNGLYIGGHNIDQIVEAPASKVRMVAGNVNSAGTETRDIGNKYTVSRTAAGTYLIYFTPAFTQVPVVVVQGGPDGNAVDNFYHVNSVTKSYCYIRSSDDDPGSAYSHQDAAFNFIAIGQ